MFHITCTLPNASKLINGIEFAAHETIEGAVRTVEAVEASVAAAFKGIKGYVITDAEEAPAVITFPPTDEQVDGMNVADLAAMLTAQNVDISVPELKSKVNKAAKLKELAAAARKPAE